MSPKKVGEDASLRTLAERLQAAVKAAGGNTEVARRCDIPLRTLNNYLAGDVSPPALAVLRIANACGVTTDALLAGIGGDPPASVARAARMRLALERADVDGKMAVTTRVPRVRLQAIMAGTLEPDPAFVALLAHATGVSQEWIWEGEPDRTDAEAEEMVYLPVLDVAAAAGAGATNDRATVIRRIPFSARTLRRLGVPAGRAHAIRARGDSMEPTIADGGIVLVDSSQTRLSQDGVYALVVDDQARLKRVAPHVDGSVSLISDNPGYPPERVAKADLERIKVVGRAFWTERLL
jgi:phage repressor protein C with HTH and peptisase S24 domain